MTSELKDKIIIEDWAGNVLYEGSYTSKKVDKVLRANYCDCRKKNLDDYCEACGRTGYIGDFEVKWADPNEKRNVYECIDY